MDTIISVQEIRSSLASIARRAESGESFTVVRNSKPAFRIVPMGTDSVVREPAAGYRSGRSEKPLRATTAAEIRASFEKTGANKLITPNELDQLIHEIHAERDLRINNEDREG